MCCNRRGFQFYSKGYAKNIYRSSEKDCGKCPLRAECCGKVTRFKKLDDSIHKPLYDEMHEKLSRDKKYTRFLTKRRSSRVEPVLGTLINHHNMKCEAFTNTNKEIKTSEQNNQLARHGSGQ
ncbi:transposase [Kaistella sp. PBT33-4]|uniref:transposase n=1 Tax=Kaistella sp. PBT33-4 TaxID=3032000 RepID=UPI0023D7F880|nr:transposase [Kaistella sp. PBT33-4]MDF0720451.1 transposase [Kaistella sp. PBT33-4]